MRQKQPETLLFRLLACLLAASLVSTSLMPLAQAQGTKKPAVEEVDDEDTDDADDEDMEDEAAEEADAEPDEATREAARKAFSAGKAKFDEGDFTAAYDSFKAANDVLPAPHAEYWMALALDKQEGKEAQTLTAYKVFLANPKASAVGEEQVNAAKQRVADLKTKVPGKVSVVTDPAGATVSVDGKLHVNQTPLDLELAAGPHTISVQLEGYEPHELNVTVEGGEATEQRIELRAKPEPPPAPVAKPEPAPAPPPAAKEERSMVPAYVTLGIAGAGLITGTIFGLQALSKQSDYDDNPTTDAADDVERNALIADMAFGIAITLGVTGVVLLTSDDSAPGAKDAARSKKRDGQLVVAPYAGPTGGGAAARLVF